MDISVIVPVYGTEAYIEECLISLFNQTKTKNVEFILVNDCTKDRSIDIANKVISDYKDLDITIINHEKNKGIAATRQTGIDASKGYYVIQIDSDDWCEPKMLEELYNKAKMDNSDIVICDYYINDDKMNCYVDQPIANNCHKTIELLLSDNLLGYSWNKLIKRELYTFNNIDYIEGINFAEDLIVNIKLFSNTENISYLNKAYVYYRKNQSSLSSKLSSKSILDWAMAYQEIYDYLLSKNIPDLLNLTRVKMIKFKFCRIRDAKNLKEQILYTKLYPEFTSNLLSFKELPIHQRFALYLACKDKLFWANKFWSLIDTVKSTYKALKG